MLRYQCYFKFLQKENQNECFNRTQPPTLSTSSGPVALIVPDSLSYRSWHCLLVPLSQLRCTVSTSKRESGYFTLRVDPDDSVLRQPMKVLNLPAHAIPLGMDFEDLLADIRPFDKGD